MQCNKNPSIALHFAPLAPPVGAMLFRSSPLTFLFPLILQRSTFTVRAAGLQARSAAMLFDPGGHLPLLELLYRYRALMDAARAVLLPAQDRSPTGDAATETSGGDPSVRQKD
ncbi:hypothetical protein [Leptothrix discophora]|uniref:Uncharacterized protein n=1 Tax=Leptothrix discophora TaxID=89 RepID=A0ABT9FYP6_LEPDI|nr:hypothetical protein [Leptothrix discophora]MDP4299265.1 hypothetical protein [Leptothrix discophora]